MPRTKTSLRKIRSIIFLMLLTLILAITATYAWFSTQRDIEVSGMRLNVEVAESLQISLDGEIWTQSIQIANMRQFYGTYTGTGDGFAIYQAKKPDDGGNTNYVPTELLPVSSAGEVANGKLQFVQGTIENNADGTTKLKGITACSESDLTATETVANRQNGNASHPYLVFDMYLRNISAKTTGLDELLLNAGSAVWVNGGTTDDGEQEGAGVAGTGLEYSARIGMVVYGNTISTTATDTESKTIGQQIRELGAKGDEVAAIWEPNHKEHTAYVVANNGRGITSTTQEVDTYGIKVAIASAETKEIANINATNDSNLVAVDTFTPAYTSAEDGVTTKTIITNTAGNNLGIAPNQISKVRVYVWLEGQDPDCIDLASTGDKLNVTLKLTKDQTTNDDNNSYVGKGANTPTQVGEIITANEVMASDYGAYVTNYRATNGINEELGITGWRIFHTDGTNIYLIADNYVKNTYVPEGANKTGTYNDTYCFKLTDVAEGTDYTGMGDITSTLKTKLLSKFGTNTNTTYNGKATAYLMDSNKWSGFGNTYTDYAIGGPTLELFVASYNATHETDIDIQVLDKGNGYGYELKWSSASSYGNSVIMEYSTIDNDGLYFIKDNTRAYANWVASPSAGGSSCMFAIVCLVEGERAYLSYNRYLDTENGARPIVSLKSNIKLQKQENGTYLIVE